MKITVENVGIIKSAQVKFNGLSIISGENDTGKSTIGKLLFSIIYSAVNQEKTNKESKQRQAFRHVETIYFMLRSSMKLDDEIKKEFKPKEFCNQLAISNIDSLLDFKISCLQEIAKQHTSFDLTAALNVITQLRILYSNAEKNPQNISKLLNKVFLSEFSDDFYSKLNDEKSTISISSGENSIIDIDITDNHVCNISTTDNLFFEDVTVIESATILQNLSLFESATTLLDYDANLYHQRPIISIQTNDLAEKLLLGLRLDRQSESYQEDFNISEIIQGQGFFKDKLSRKLYFLKYYNQTQNQKIDILNVSSGIKSFGILQLLLRIGAVNSRSLLIINEPENYLHPDWQVKFADIIVQLVKKGANILLTSNSSYIIRALQTFSAEAHLQDVTHFYLADKKDDDDQSTFEDVTQDLNKIFKKFYEPLRNL